MTVPTPSTPGDNRRDHVPTAGPLAHARVYPLPRTTDDPRFSFGLTLDVAEALAAHGYPIGSGADFVALQDMLFRFLYGPAAHPTAPADEAGR